MRQYAYSRLFYYVKDKNKIIYFQENKILFFFFFVLHCTQICLFVINHNYPKALPLGYVMLRFQCIASAIFF